MLFFNKEDKEVFRDLFYKCGGKITADHYNVDDDKVFAYAAKHYMFTRQRQDYLQHILDDVIKEVSPNYSIEVGSTLHRIIIASMNEVTKKARGKNNVIPE